MPNVTANPTVATDPAFGVLKDHIIQATGLAYYADKELQLAAKVQARLAAVKLPGCRDYLELLRRGHEGENELNELAADLTIGETFFPPSRTVRRAAGNRAAGTHPQESGLPAVAHLACRLFHRR